jgi:hypothetical protein
MAALANKRQRISISSGALFCENTLHRHRSIDRSVGELRRLIAVVVNELVVLVSEAFFLRSLMALTLNIRCRPDGNVPSQHSWPAAGRLAF